MQQWLFIKMRFTKNWFREVTPSGKVVYRPTLVLEIKEKTGIVEHRFIVDSGADMSLMPKRVADEMSIDWKKGEKAKMKGIAEERMCWVEGRIHEIDVIIPDLKLEIQIPVCFVKGNAPFLLGRDGFFDYFKVTFEKFKLKTVFELIEEKN